MSNNFETVRDTRNMSVNHDYETEVALSDHNDVISCGQLNLVISETMHPTQKVTMERYQEIMVALSESVMKNCLKRSLAED